MIKEMLHCYHADASFLLRFLYFRYLQFMQKSKGYANRHFSMRINAISKEEKCTCCRNKILFALYLYILPLKIQY